MLRAAAFDLDGTIIDSTTAIVEAYRHVFVEIGEPVPEAARIVRTIGYTLEHFSFRWRRKGKG